MWMPLLLAALVLCLSGPASAGSFTVPDQPGHWRLESALTYFCDQGRQLDPAHGLDSILQQPFQPLPSGRISFGYLQDSRCWFEFRLANAGAGRHDLILDADYGGLDRLVLYQLGDNGWRAAMSGDAVPFGSRALPTRKHAFPLSLEAGQEVRFLLSAETINSFLVPLTLWDAGAFRDHYLFQDWVAGGFYGIGIAMLVYNLFLWLSLRERAYLWYLLYVGSTLLALGCWQGSLHRFWPDAVTFNNLLLQNSVYAGCLAMLQFARAFLDTHKRPVLDRVLQGYVLLIAGLLLSQLLLPAKWLAIPLGAVTIGGCLLAFAAGLVRLGQGVRPAWVYVIAWTSFLVMAVFISLGVYGLLPAVSLVIEWLQVALVIQQVMLSFGLAMRINQLRDERDERDLRAAKAEAESAAKTDFMARMSHEIRTPMNAVLGISALMNDARLGEAEQKRYLETLHASGQTLMHVINDMLDFSRMSAGKMPLEEGDFDLHALVHECVSMFSPSANDKSVQISEHIDDAVPRWVTGDAIRVRQILLNLLGNAVKFTERGAILVSLTQAADDASGEALSPGEGFPVCLKVSDTGPGIHPDDQQKLFQPFEQLDGTSTRRYGGTGLGLAISRQLAELMGGSITLDSTPGEGARFSVFLRFMPGEEVAQRPAGQDQFELQELAVLVVEDNPVNQMVIRALLMKMGIKSMLAHDGRQGLDYIKLNHSQLDLVLMDCEMPVMDGYQASRLLREWEQRHKLKHLPVVAMTAHAFAEHRDRCLQSGMDDHMAKPLQTAEVNRLLQRVAASKKELSLLNPARGKHVPFN